MQKDNKTYIYPVGTDDRISLPQTYHNNNDVNNNNNNNNNKVTSPYFHVIWLFVLMIT